VGTAIKARRPEVRVIGVEPRNAPTAKASLDAGEIRRIETQPTLADGLRVAQIGRLCFDIIRRVVDDIVLVDEPQIAKAVLRLLEMEKTVVEGAGAVPLAAAWDQSLDLRGKKVVLCLCGGNIDATLISRIIERGMSADGRLCRIIARISDRPGSLARLLGVIAETGASIKEVSHDRSFGPADIAHVAVSCIIETRDASHIAELHDTLRGKGLDFTAA
jgi:threonine dehydratase